MQDAILIALTIGVFALLALVLYLVMKLSRGSSGGKDTERTLILLQEQLKVLNESSGDKIEKTRQEIQQILNYQNELLSKQMNESQKTIQQQFMISQKSMSDSKRETTEIIKSVTEKLAFLEKTNTQVVDFAKQMQSLENILKNPKQRGVLGEYFLETTLKNVLPPDTYQMQYKFKNGEIVDAAVFVKDKIIPIDSKFSLENYNRIVEEDDPVEKEKLEKLFKNDLKNRIDETSKYIRPDEGTMEFAFMFIPSEGIYYDLLVNQVGAIKVNTRDLIQYAFAEKNVIIVSPTSFLAYLQTVLQGLRALKIEESAMQIKSNVSRLVQHLKAYEENFEKLGKNLGTTVGFYNKAYKEFQKVDKDVLKITGDALEISAEELDKPSLFEE